MRMRLRGALRRALTSTAVVAVATAGIVATTPVAGAEGTATPWAGQDPNQASGLTFYDATGNVITGGSTTAKPFAAYVQGRQGLRAGDDTATLFGYRPTVGATPDTWSDQEQLGLSTTYPNPAAPAPVKTSSLPVNTGGNRDLSLDNLAADFPTTSADPNYANVYEIRMYTSSEANGLGQKYDYADIKINPSAHTWSLVYSPGSGPAAGQPGTFVATAPTRLLDTRSSVGASTPASAGTVHLQVLGNGPVPASGVSAVVLNVTVVKANAGGFITVYADGATKPSSSNLNFVAGETIPNQVIAPVGSNGKVALYNGSSGPTNLLADVAGYYVSGTPSVAGAFASTAPTRLLDTRNGTGGTTPASAGTVHLAVLGNGPVPASGVSAVVLNVTVVKPAAGGFVTAYADGATKPSSSNLNFVAGKTIPNLVVAPVGSNGKVALYNGSSGATNMLADVAGYFLAGTPKAKGTFVSTAPTRLLDTRNGTGASTPAPAGTVHLQVAGNGPVPAGNVSAAVLNVTVVKAAKGGFVTAYADGASKPSASNLNFVAGQTIPNLVVAPVGSNGKVALYNGSSGANNLLADVAGYYLAADLP